MPRPYQLRCRLKNSSKSQSKDDPNKSSVHNWRMRMKTNNPERYKQLLQMNKTSCQIYRLEMAMAEDMKMKRNLSEDDKERMEMLLERKRKYNEGAKMRMRKMRAKNTLKSQGKKGAGGSGKPHTRLEKEKHAEQKAKWRKAKQEKANRLTARKEETNQQETEGSVPPKETAEASVCGMQQLKEAERKLAEQQRQLFEAQALLQQQQEQLNEATDELQQAGEDLRSSAAKRKSLQRARGSIPRTPAHFVTTVIDLIEKSSPRKAARLKNKVCTAKEGLFDAAIRNVRKAAREFRVSRKLLGKAKRYQSGRKPLSAATVQLVIDFYEASSKDIPDKTLVSKRSGKASAIIDQPIVKLYKQFCESNPTVKIGLAKFNSLRSKHVKPMSAAKFAGCVCEYCANFDLKVKAINTHLVAKQLSPIKDTYEFSALTMCPKPDDSKFHKPECLKRTCTDCGVHQLDGKFAALRDNGMAVHWKRWELVKQVVKGETCKSVKKRALLFKSGSMEELLGELMEEADPFPAHLFTKDWQNAQLQVLRSNLPQKSVLGILDFAENYTCKHQDEAQTAYWTHESATVHPIVTYYRCPTCNDVNRESLVIISDDLLHDHHAVHEFQFSDGCGTQYKSKGPISDISYALADFGLSYHHNYSGTRHGKGASDGESAVIKSSASTAVKAGRAVIRNAKELFQYAKENLTKEPSVDQCKHHLRTVFFVELELFLRGLYSEGFRYLQQQSLCGCMEGGIPLSAYHHSVISPTMKGTVDNPHSSNDLPPLSDPPKQNKEGTGDIPHSSKDKTDKTRMAYYYTFSPEPEALHPKGEIVAILGELEMKFLGRALVYQFMGIETLKENFMLN
ncbi:hypothetical protein HOLleu_13627 [Holothuria leucospilota]|uniref:Uncharacterized protein n=1 Tax=Holothuria leucospilota TaxID=206669 RepID=A0A9Q1CD92_HOLLE|nr:hypothetical protein HOLleu_13627 [Holothuria leucospilota]